MEWSSGNYSQGIVAFEYICMEYIRNHSLRDHPYITSYNMTSIPPYCQQPSYLHIPNPPLVPSYCHIFALTQHVLVTQGDLHLIFFNEITLKGTIILFYISTEISKSRGPCLGQNLKL